ncbi:MAG: epoxyqueuosine reductase QueH [Lachnospiraceae bacterium]
MRQMVQKEMDHLLQVFEMENYVPTLLLHSCCAPCSSYVLEYLSKYFSITDFFYNPNITQPDEYSKRKEELQRLVTEMKFVHPVKLRYKKEEPEVFFRAVKGMEQEPEGGARCEICFELRLREAARLAAELNLDYFATTLTISPLKNANKINAIGLALQQEYGVKYLASDFKKKEGYKRSIELSKEYQLYRQDFCGCIYSKGSTTK